MTKIGQMQIENEQCSLDVRKNQKYYKRVVNAANTPQTGSRL